MPRTSEPTLDACQLLSIHVQVLETEATTADEQIQKGGVVDDAANGIKDQLDALKSAFGLQ